MKEVIELLEKINETEHCTCAASRLKDGIHSLKCAVEIANQALSLLKPELLTAVCRKCDKPFQTTSDKDRLCPDCSEQPATGEWDEPCQTCEGSKKVRCSRCCGDGHLPAGGHSNKCYECAGEGKVPCPACQEKLEPSGELVKELRQRAKHGFSCEEDRYNRAAARIEQLEEKSAFAVRRIKRDRVRIEQLTERIEELEAKPLLFGDVEFNVITSDKVPEGEIWFATKEQLETALEYSAKQIEQAMKEEAKDGKPKIH